MDEGQRRKTLRMVPYALYLLGTRRGGSTSAYVVSWVTQASFKPPMIVVCMGRESHALSVVKETRVFSLNVLGSDQKDLAKLFFKDAAHEPGRMNGVAYHAGAATGCPVFPGLPAHVECEVVEVVEGENDHAVVLARVVAAEHRREARPLTTAEAGWTYAG